MAVMDAATRRSGAAAAAALERLAQEPLSGLYHVREHVGRSVPRLVSLSAGLERAGACAAQAEEDAGFYAARARALGEAVPPAADSIERSLTRAFKAVDAIRQQKRAAGGGRRFPFSPGASSAASPSASPSASSSSSLGALSAPGGAQRRASPLSPPAGARSEGGDATPTSRLKEGS